MTEHIKSPSGHAEHCQQVQSGFDMFQLGPLDAAGVQNDQNNGVNDYNSDNSGDHAFKRGNDGCSCGASHNDSPLVKNALSSALRLWIADPFLMFSVGVVVGLSVAIGYLESL